MNRRVGEKRCEPPPRPARPAASWSVLARGGHTGPRRAVSGSAPSWHRPPSSFAAGGGESAGRAPAAHTRALPPAPRDGCAAVSKPRHRPVCAHPTGEAEAGTVPRAARVTRARRPPPPSSSVWAVPPGPWPLTPPSRGRVAGAAPSKPIGLRAVLGFFSCFKNRAHWGDVTSRDRFVSCASP